MAGEHTGKQVVFVIQVRSAVPLLRRGDWRGRELAPEAT